MCIQNLIRIVPSAASERSKPTISSWPRRHSSSDAYPSTRSTSTRPYQERSNTATPPQPGSLGKKRQRKWCRFSSEFGAEKAATLTCRWSSCATSRLIAPPFPDASQPSNSISTGGPRRPSPISPASCRRSASSRSCAASSRLSCSLLDSFCERSTSSSLPMPGCSHNGPHLEREPRQPQAEDERACLERVEHRPVGLHVRDVVYADRYRERADREVHPERRDAVAVGVDVDDRSLGQVAGRHLDAVLRHELAVRATSPHPRGREAR